MNSFKLYVTGAQGVGKTAITKLLLNILENTEALQIVEVDFLKDAFRRNINIMKEKLGKVFPENPEGNEIAKYFCEQTESILGEREFRKALKDSSYDHNFDELDKQSIYLFPRLIHALERHTEKGISTIIEGLNIPIERLIEHYREKAEKDKKFNMDSIMIVNLWVDTLENHTKRIELRISDRQLVDDEAENQLSFMKNIFKINERYKDITEEMKVNNTDIHIYNIDNSGQKDKYTVAMEIIEKIAQSGNFIGSEFLRTK